MEQLSQAMFTVGVPSVMGDCGGGGGRAGPAAPASSAGADLGGHAGRARRPARRRPAPRRRGAAPPGPSPVSQTSVRRRSAGSRSRSSRPLRASPSTISLTTDCARPRCSGGLADGQRARDREVREHGAGRAGQVAARPVAPVVGEVERAEQGGEPLRAPPARPTRHPARRSPFRPGNPSSIPMDRRASGVGLARHAEVEHDGVDERCRPRPAPCAGRRSAAGPARRTSTCRAGCRSWRPCPSGRRACRRRAAWCLRRARPSSTRAGVVALHGEAARRVLVGGLVRGDERGVRRGGELVGVVQRRLDRPRRPGPRP